MYSVVCCWRGRRPDSYISIMWLLSTSDSSDPVLYWVSEWSCLFSSRPRSSRNPLLDDDAVNRLTSYPIFYRILVRHERKLSAEGSLSVLCSWRSGSATLAQESVDRGFIWSCHLDNVCCKLSSGVYVLRQLSKYCQTQFLMTAYYDVILYSHLSYGLTLWGGCTKTNSYGVFCLQIKAIRIIAKSHRGGRLDQHLKVWNYWRFPF